MNPKTFGGLLTFWIFGSLPFLFLGRAALFPWAEPIPADQERLFNIATAIIFFGPLVILAFLFLRDRKRAHSASDLD